MLILIALAVFYALVQSLWDALLRSLAQMPRSNDDFIYL